MTVAPTFSLSSPQRRERLFRFLENLDGGPLPFITPPLQFEIGSVPFALHVEGSLRDRLNSFLKPYTTDHPPRLTIFLELGHSLPSSWWEDANAEFDSRGDRGVQRDFAARWFRHGAIPRVRGLLNPDAPLDGALNLLRWILPPLLRDEQGALIHGASALWRGMGLLFFGRSGVGKTTTVRRLELEVPELEVLGDDAAIVQWGPQGPWLLSAPLGSAHRPEPPAPRRVPLAGCFALEQSARSEVSRLPSAEGVGRLLASTMAPHFSDVFEGLPLASRLAQVDPGVHRLALAAEGPVWSLVESVLNRKERTQ